MRARALSRLALAAFGVLALSAATCGGDHPSVPRGGGDDTELRWYLTCGDPVCRGYTPPAGVPLCADQDAGEPCTTEGAKCDPVSDCNQLLVCATSDPQQQPGGCPISMRSAKEDIAYLTPEQLEAVRERLLAVRLATYRYAGTTDERLGFVIDDVPTGPQVLPNGRQVDVYGYASMAVAALQVQAQEIESLRAEVERLRALVEPPQP